MNLHFPYPLFLLCGLLSTNSAQCQWDDYTEFYLLEGTTQASWLGCGMSLADFNLDGLEDVTLANSDGTVVAYAQQSQGGFQLAYQWPGDVQAQGLSWADFDGDDDLDLLVSRRFGRIELYMSDGVSLTEEALSRGFPDDASSEARGFSVADYDGDGDIDVYLCMYHDGTTGLSENVLYNNDGHGHFTDVTESAGVGNGLKHSFQAVWYDENGDGLLDLWVINDRQVFPNALYRNLGNGLFEDVSVDLNLAQGISAMSATIGDPDNDGQMELFCSDVEGVPNIMMDRNGGVYQSVGSLWGVDGMRYSWGGCWVDADGDMWSDLMVGTYRFPNSLPYDNYFYLNAQFTAPFTDETELWPNEQTQVYAVGALDVNQDLAPDVCAFGNSPFAQVLQNTTQDDEVPPHRLVVELCATSGHAQAFGAQLTVHSGGIAQTQIVTNGSDYMTQQSTHRFFGLADHAVVDSLVVQWPGGLREVWYDVDADQVLRLVEGETTAQAAVSGGECHGDSAWVHFPFDAPMKRWNGTVIEQDSVLLTSGGEHILECEWLNGLFTWSDTTFWDPAPPHSLTVEWAEPLCAGEPGLLGWIADPGFQVEFAGIGSEIWSAVEVGLEAPAGTWDLVTIHPETGCTQVHPFTLPEPAPLGIYIDYQPALCHDDVALALAEGYGGTPDYLVNWNGANPADLSDGPVTVSMTDGAGCELDTTWVVNLPAPLAFEVDLTPEDQGGDAAIALDIEGGTPPYDILWNDGTVNDTLLEGLSQGVYSWVIQDANGCVTLGLQEVWNLGADSESGHALQWHVEDGQPVLTGGRSFPLRVSAYTLDGRMVLDRHLQGPCPCPLDAAEWPSHGVLLVRDGRGEVLLRTVY